MKISVTTHNSYQMLPFYYICMTSIICFIATIVVQTFIDSYDWYLKLRLGFITNFIEFRDI